LSVSTVTCRRRLPIIERIEVGVIGGFHTQLALIGKVFDRTTEGHATLVFLLTAGFDGAVAFFVRLSHFESPKACTGASRWTLFMTTWRKRDDRGMKAENKPAGASLPRDLESSKDREASSLLQRLFDA
jgi:hypothetical protein